MSAVALALAACGRSTPSREVPDLLVDSEVVLDTVDIGVDAPSVEDLWIENVGTGVLSVRLPRFLTDGAFSVSGEDVTLDRMESYAYELAFDPLTPFMHEAVLVVDSDDADSPRTELRVRADATAPVLDVVVSPIDFGLVPARCEVDRPLAVVNAGNEPLVVTPSLVGSPELSLASLEPFEIAPSDRVELELTYRPVDGTEDVASLTLETNDPLVPVVSIDLRAAGAATLSVTDSHVRAAAKSDVVFIVDNGESMATEQGELAESIDAFVAAFDATATDYHIGVITTDYAGFAGGTVVTRTTADPTAVLADLVVAGTGGSGTTRGMQMLYECAAAGGDCSKDSGFLRDGALFVAVVVSDQPDQSALAPVDYVDALASLADGFRFHAIAGNIPSVTCSTCASPGFGYDQSVELTGGAFVDICASDWEAMLAQLADRSLGDPVQLYALSQIPDPATIVVRVGGAIVEGWSYHDEVWPGAVWIYVDSLPAVGAHIEISYDIAAVCP